MSRTEIELIDISNRIQDVRYLKKGITDIFCHSLPLYFNPYLNKRRIVKNDTNVVKS
ncbi:MAG: hypothetical protein HXN45_03735 [Prevotella nanceiensis]|nr:hypothetical protein [Hoylesella nanceiensis]